MDVARVKDIMTDSVVSVRPETPILETARIIADHKFSGVPVVGASNELVGLVTEYSLINEKSLLHLPTLQRLLQKLPGIQLPADFADNVKKVELLRTVDVMDKKPLTLYFDDTFEAAVALFNAHHRINPVPVIDHDNKVVGVLARYDLIKLLKMYGHS